MNPMKYFWSANTNKNKKIGLVAAIIILIVTVVIIAVS